MRIRPLSDTDIATVLALNEASVEALSPLTADGLGKLRELVAQALVCDVDGQVAAFALAFGPGAAYDSLNYRWHAKRCDDFLYLDRIVVNVEFRRRGVATALYDAMESAAESHGRMVCEVNSDPPNPESLGFHRGRGYHEVGHLTQLDGHQTVMMEKLL